MSIEAKISMFKTYIRPIMTFAAETRADISIKKGNEDTENEFRLSTDRL